MADETEVGMKCSICIEVYGVQILVEGQVPENRHSFLHGSNNFRKSAVIDHENSTVHKSAVTKHSTKAHAASSHAGTALKTLKKTNRE